MAVAYCCLLLIRHGRTVSNVEGVYAGWSDVPLDEVGREQAATLGQRLAALSLSAVYSSPVQRALETAGPIAAARELPVVPAEELGELRMPGWQGLGEREIAARHPVEWDTWTRNPAALESPHVESLSRAAQRVRKLVSELGRRHAQEIVALVTHEAIVRLILLTSLGIELRAYRSFHVPNGSLSALAWRPESAHLILLGDTSHHDGGRLSVLDRAARA